MDLYSIFKIYDSDGDGSLSQNELLELQNDIDYQFSEKEKQLFELNENIVSFDKIIGAIEYEDIDINLDIVTNVLHSLDKENDGKIFIPELINVLKYNKYFSSKDLLNELLINLNKDDQYYIYK